VRGQLYNFSIHAIGGSILGFLVTLILFMAVSKNGWLNDLNYWIRQYQVSKTIDGSIAYLDQDLRAEVFELDNKIKTIRRNIASDQKLSKSQYYSQLSQKLKDWQNEMVKQAILAQRSRIVLGQILNTPDFTQWDAHLNALRESIAKEKDRLESANEYTKPSLQEHIKAKEQKLMSLRETQSMIESCQYRLKNLKVLLDQLNLAINKSKWNSEENLMSNASLEDEITVAIQAIDQTLQFDDVDDLESDASLSNAPSTSVTDLSLAIEDLSLQTQNFGSQLNDEPQETSDAS
jgi:hypothetical protein